MQKVILGKYAPVFETSAEQFITNDHMKTHVKMKQLHSNRVIQSKKNHNRQ